MNLISLEGSIESARSCTSRINRPQDLGCGINDPTGGAFPYPFYRETCTPFDLSRGQEGQFKRNSALVLPGSSSLLF